MDALSMYTNQTRAVAADATTKSIGGISATSSREEIEGAVKDFETFMMEKVIKEVKKSFVGDEDEDDTVGMYKDLYMDKAITEIASQLVDQIGGDVTDDFVEQIMRNYGITGNSNLPTDTVASDDVQVSDDIAEINASTVTQVQA